MSDAKLWIDDADSTATITGVNVSYTMPLWVFDVMRDIIVTEAEKKVEVTHRDFDIQQELLDRYRAENAKLRERIHELEMEGSDHFYRTAYAEDANRTLEAENAKLREQMERLVTLLRNDCDIDASWDGLRKFWSIGLTEDGCLMRDRACKAEAENARLQELLDFVLPIVMYAASTEEGDRIRELMREVTE